MRAVSKLFCRLALLVFGVLLLVGFDQWVKFAVSKQGGFFIWPDFLDIGFYQNYGIAFGIPLPLYLIYPLIAVSLMLISWRYRQKLGQGNVWVWLACLLIFTGAASNLFDRLYWGYVIDYIHFSFGSTFNLADMMVVGGVGVLLWRELKKAKS